MPGSTGKGKPVRVRKQAPHQEARRSSSPGITFSTGYQVSGQSDVPAALPLGTQLIGYTGGTGRHSRAEQNTGPNLRRPGIVPQSTAQHLRSQNKVTRYAKRRLLA